MALQIGCFHGYGCIGGSMGFIEGILCEVDHLVVDSFGILFGYAVLYASKDIQFFVAVNKIFLLSKHYIHLFFRFCYPRGFLSSGSGAYGFAHTGYILIRSVSSDPAQHKLSPTSHTLYACTFGDPERTRYLICYTYRVKLSCLHYILRISAKVQQECVTVLLFFNLDSYHGISIFCYET